MRRRENSIKTQDNILRDKIQKCMKRIEKRVLHQTPLHAATSHPFHTQTLLHADAFTQTLLHTDSFTHKHFYKQMLLHTDAFTHRRFYTQTLFHTNTFTHQRFYTPTLLHTETLLHTNTFCTQALLHTDAFPHRGFYTQTLLHTEAFTHGRFYTQTLLHTDAFTHRRFYTQALLGCTHIESRSGFLSRLSFGMMMFSWVECSAGIWMLFCHGFSQCFWHLGYLSWIMDRNIDNFNSWNRLFEGPQN